MSMQFIIIANDHPDAAERRKESRGEHLKLMERMKAEGKVLFAAAILNDEGEMAGSMLVCDFQEGELKPYLAAEPYVMNRVWGDVKATACKVPPLFAVQEGG